MPSKKRTKNGDGVRLAAHERRKLEEAADMLGVLDYYGVEGAADACTELKSFLEKVDDDNWLPIDETIPSAAEPPSQ